jgi:hypothetical protein
LTKIRQLVGYEPAMDLQKLLVEIVEYYRPRVRDRR